MTFSSIESSINAATLGVISNASMTWGAVAIPVVFDATYADPLGMAVNQPRARCASSLHAGMALGAAVSINAISYTVQAIEPDGTGITNLQLRRV